jgi:hypothetical protein
MALAHQLPTVVSLPSEQEAALTYKLSTNAATLCGEIVKATAQNIQGRKYVKVEGWLALAAAHGCLVSIREVDVIEGGVRAIAELRRMSDQALLATAEGFVGEDEKMWAGRPMYARRAMAQTRASSRVCRTVFAFAVVLIDKDLGTTPAEEVPNEGWAGSHGDVDPADQGLRANAPKFTSGQLTRMKKWLEGAMGTMQLSGQTVGSLDAFWNENAAKVAWLEENMPAEHKALDAAYMASRDAAEARAG